MTLDCSVDTKTRTDPDRPGADKPKKFTTVSNDLKDPDHAEKIQIDFSQSKTDPIKTKNSRINSVSSNPEQYIIKFSNRKIK